MQVQDQPDPEQDQPEEDQPIDVNPDVTLETKKLIGSDAQDDNEIVAVSTMQDKPSAGTTKVKPIGENSAPAPRRDTEQSQSGAGISLSTFKLPFAKQQDDYLKGGWYECCSENSIHFDPNIKADKATFFDDSKKEKLKPAYNMQSYIDNYAVDFKIPAYYVKDAKFFPQDPTHMLQLSVYECDTNKDKIKVEDEQIHEGLLVGDSNNKNKQNEEQIVINHDQEGQVEVNTFASIHDNYDQKGLVLRLLVRIHTTLKFIDEKVFDEKEGFMELHRDGDLFAMYFGIDKHHPTPKIKILTINEGEHNAFVHKFDNFGTNDGDIEFQGGSDPENDISFIRKMKFDVEKRYLVGWGDNKVFILHLASQKHQIIQNNSRLYSQICDLNFTSRSDDDKDYKCYVSCSRKDIKQISNFDLMEDLQLRSEYGTPYHNQTPPSNCTINYLNDLHPNFMTKISSDDEQIVFANGQENYILKTMGVSYHEQKKLKQLKSREIRAIREDYDSKGGFYLMVHKDYDKFVNIEHTNRMNMDVRIPKKIEPGILKFFDVNIIKSKEKEDSGGNTPMEIRMITQKGDEFMLDKVTYDELYDNVTLENSLNQVDPMQLTQRNHEYFNYIFSPLRAASTSWPFFAISAIGNYILIVNAYDPKKVQRVQIAGEDEKITICETFITQTNDLYVATQENQLFKLYTLDLDQINKFSDGQQQKHLKFEQILQYEDTVVDMQSLKQIHVRGSSRKQLFDMNEKLQVFFLHGEMVYSWIQLNDEQPLRKVRKSTSKMTPMGDKSFYIQCVEKNKKTKVPSKQTIYKIDILFSSYDVSKVYAEINLQTRMKTFLVDEVKNKLFILFKSMNTAGYIDYLLKILELNTTKSIQEMRVKDMELVGRLKSDIFTFEDGYIYYNNTVIKIRYDLIDKRDRLLNSDQVFDKYPDIFGMDMHQSIKFGTPLKSSQSHRFAYIIIDDSQKKCNQVRIMPYLHEKRIYLNKQQVNTEYFYTAVETPVELIHAYNRNVKLPIAQREETDIKIKSRIDRTPKKSSELKEYRENPAPTMTSIICFDLLRASFDVYSQNGQLINQVDYSQLQKNYGQPVKISSNGTNVVFKQTLDQLEDAEIKYTSDNNLKQEFMSVHLVQTSIFGLNKVKTINLLTEIRNLQQKSMSAISAVKGLASVIPAEDTDWLFDPSLDYKSMIELIDLAFEITDELEVCIRIAPSQKYKDQHKMGAELKTIFYFENMFDKKQMYLRVEEQDLKYGMNSNYLIFYNTEGIKFFNLSSEFKDSNLKDSGFSISVQEPPVIRQIRTTNQSHIIIIVITQNPDSVDDKIQDSVIIWNLEKKNEIDSFDLEEEYIIIQDAIGNPYIITPTKTYMVMQLCAACVYDCIDPLHKAVESMKGSVTINVSKGVRFDTNNHNWLILYEYLSLGYSYMTFMMRDKIQQRHSCLDGNEFDLEPYNYIYNKTTAFFEGKFVVDNHERLQKILINCFRINEDSLDLLHYTQDVMKEQGSLAIGNAEFYKKSALHRAFESGNQKCQDLIMVQMAHIKKNGSANFSHILQDSTEAGGFEQYFGNLPFQNNQMGSKSIIKGINGEHSEGIIAISHSPTQYVDNKFFKKYMGEDEESNQARPCRIIALRCGWLFKTQEGKQFLNNILASGNLDHYDIKSLQLVIEFLFQKYKYIIMTTMFPLYIFSHVTYAGLNLYMDKFLTDLWNNDKILDKSDHHDRRLLDETCNTCDINIKDTQSVYKNTVLIWQYLNLISACGQVFIMGCQIYSSGSAYFKRFYSIFDILYVMQIIFTFTAVRLFLLEDDVQADRFETLANLFRKVGIFGTICLFLKASYFLSLLDPVAPLIDIIFQIFFDIKYFVVVLLIFILMIAMCFQLIASLQVDFDNVAQDEIEYFEPKQAFWYGIQFMFGGASGAAYDLGDGSQKLWLQGLHFAANFLIVLHLLNMLIAIMGATYGNRDEVGHQIMKKDHLRFVMDNWILMHFAFMNQQNQLEFLIAALPLDDEDVEETSLSEIYTKLDTFVKSVDNQFGRARIVQNETQLMVMEFNDANRSMRRQMGE